MFVIQRNEDGKYACPPGQISSYTGLLQKARQFSTRESAEAEKCDNELVVPVSDILPKGRHRAQ